MAKIKVAVVGAGIGKVHLQGYQAHPQAEVVALCDLNQGLARQVATEFNVPQVFDDLTQMLRAVPLDAISVCVPNKFHLPVVVECLQAGVNVLCEKPLARTAAEGKKMVAAAEAAGKLLMVQFNNRYRPESALLKQYADSGELGEVYFARAGWIRRNGIPGWGSWFTQREMAGGGPLIDLAVHMLDLTMWLMSNPEPEVVLASTYSAFGPQMEALGPWGTPNKKGLFDVEDMACAMIKFAGGKTIMLEASWAQRIKREFVYSTLCGTQAGASLERVFDVDGADDSSRDTLQLYTQEHGIPVNRDLIVEPDPAMGRLKAVSHFVDCLISGAQCCSPGTDGLRIMKILDAAYKSADTGKAVNIR
jgi:predicted dehydrogenase